MKKNKIVARTLATAVVLGAMGTAQAVPIEFEFSGIAQTVSAGNEDWIGQVATGRFLIETDNFSVLPTPPPTVTWTDVLPVDARPAPITASISIDDDFISLNDAVETYGGIHFNGSCAPFCNPGWIETWGISGNTQSFPLGGQPGSPYTVSSLSFSSRGPAETDFIPDSGLTPLDILTLPLGNLYASYTAWEILCVPGDDFCSQTNYTTLQFQVSSVSRTLVSTEVPEPGTFALLGVALAGVFVMRRRVAAR
jgi:hypothetical protein